MHCSRFIGWYMLLMSSIGREISAKYHIQSQTPRLRVLEGWTDVNERYPFVVALIKRFLMKRSQLHLRICTGSVISNQFVITAAHCLDEDVLHVRCGNMTVPWNQSNCKSKILKQVSHPSSFLLKSSLDGDNDETEVAENDIALLYIEKLDLKKYGRLGTADYKTYYGRAVKYAGFGDTAKQHKSRQEFMKDQMRPLQVGEGVIFNDNSKTVDLLARPQLLVAPKCSKRNQHAFVGDSGGPLFLDGRIVGVVCSGPTLVMSNSHHHPVYVGFTPISPYMDWIRKVIASFQTR